MSDLSKTRGLLSQVVYRLNVARMGRRCFAGAMAAAAAYVVLLLVARLTGWLPQFAPGFIKYGAEDGSWFGVVPDWAPPLSLMAVPAAGVAWALVGRRPAADDAARQIDNHAGTKDLFLTVSGLEASAGDYKSLVVNNAESKAEAIQPGKVVPFQWQHRAGHAALAFLGLLTAVLVFPQFDPFGRVEAAEYVQKEKEELRKSRKATLARAEQIKKEAENAEQTREVENAINKLKTDYRRMKPKRKKENKELIAGHRKEIGAQWRKVSDKQLQKMLSKQSSDQQFGMDTEETMSKWLKEMQEGKTEGLDQEMQSLKDELQRLAQTKDPIEKEKIKRNIKKRLQSLSNFAHEKANSKELAAALKRAMKQLDMAKSSEISKEAMQALEESLDLSKAEAKKLAEAVKELKELEDALKTMQMAEKLNAAEQLDGAQCEGCQSLSDYAEMYAQMMAQSGMGGEGDGEKQVNEGDGEGAGRGGKSSETDMNVSYKDETSESQTRAGKILLSLKTKAAPDEDEELDPNAINYQQQIRIVQQGLSEAIDREQIPPGYHDGIKKYFDNIDTVLKPESTTAND